MNRLSLCILVIISSLSYGQQTEKSILSYFEKTEMLNPIEGIWKVEIKREFYHYDTLYNVQNISDAEKVAIMKNDDGYAAYLMNGENFNLEFTTTDVKGVYMYRNFYPLTSEYSKKQAVICMRGKMEYTYDLPEEYVIKICGEDYKPNTRIVNVHSWIKMTPSQ